LELLKNRNDIENYNKKSLYILIREMTDVETSCITKVVNVLKNHYRNLVNEFHTKGYIDINVKNNRFF